MCRASRSTGHFRAHSAKDSTSTTKTGWWSKRSILLCSKGLLQEELLRVSGLCCSCDQLKIQHSWVGSIAWAVERLLLEGAALLKQVTEHYKDDMNPGRLERQLLFLSDMRETEKLQATRWSDWHVLWNWHCKTYGRSENTDETVACFTVFVMQLRDHALLFVGWRLTLGQLCLYRDWTM